MTAAPHDPTREPSSSPVTPTQLRADLFHLLDRVLETGEPLEIKRNGRILKLVVEQPVDKLSRIRPRKDAFLGDPEDLIDLKVWEWDVEQNLNP